jgi:REP element-mobilizing transposase RayT
VGFDPERHHRRSIRLKEYDYGQAGAYFVTVCAWGHECLFGEIAGGEMRLNGLGEVVHHTWRDLENHVGNLHVNEFVIMPNHIHGIITIVGAGSKPAQTKPAQISSALESVVKKAQGMTEIVRQFKSFSAKRINALRATPGVPVWQRNYYEHVIRDEADYRRIAEYIAHNPLRWSEDSLHPVAIS